MPEIRYAIIVDESGAIRSMGNFTKAVAATGTQSRSAFGPLQSSLGNVKSLAAGIGVTFGAWQVGQVVRDAVGSVVDFERAMANVETLVDTTTTQGVAQFKQLQSGILELPPALGSATDLAKGLYESLSAGVKPADAVKFVGEAAIFAKAALTDTRTAVDVLTTTLNAYGISAENTAGISSVFFKTIEIGKITGEELAHVFGRLAPITATLGISVGDASAALAVLTAGGIDADEAVTALRQVLVTILQPAKQSVDAATELGISFDDMRKKLAGEDGLRKVMAELALVFDKNETAASALFGNVRALVGALALTGPQAEKYKEAQLAMNEAMEEGNRQSVAFAKQQDTVSAKFSTLVNSLERFLLKMGAEDGLKSVLDSAAKAFEFLERNSTAVAIVLGATLLPVVVRLIGNLTLVKNAIASIQILSMVRSFSDLGTAITAIIPRIVSFGASIASVAWPAALIIGTTLLIKYISDLTGFIPHVKAFAGTIKDLAVAIGSDLSDKAKSLGLIFEDLWESTKTLASTAFEDFKNVAIEVRDIVSTGLGMVGLDVLVRLTGEAVDWLIGRLEELIDLAPSLGQLRDFFADVAQATGFVALAEQLRSFKTEAEIVADTTDTLRTGLLKSIDALEKQNAAVGRSSLDFAGLREAARTADDEGLKVLSQGVAKTAEALRGAIPQAKAVAKELDATGAAAKRLTEDQQKLLDQFKAQAQPAEAFVKKLAELKAVGVTAQQFVAAFADEIIEAAESQTKMGVSLSQTAKGLLAQADALKRERDQVKQSNEAWKARLEITSDLDHSQARYLESIDASISAMDIETAKVEALNFAWIDTTKNIAKGQQEIEAAFGRVGIKTRGELERTRTQAIKDFQLIKSSGQASARDMQTAMINALEAIRDASVGTSSQWTAAQVAALEEAKNKLGEVKAVSETTWGEIGKQISTVWTDLSKGIADAIFEFKGFGSTVLSIFKELGKSLVRTLLESAFNPLKKLFSDLFSGISSGVSGAVRAAGTASSGSGIRGALSSAGTSIRALLANGGGISGFTAGAGLLVGATRIRNPILAGGAGFIGGGLTGLALGGSSILAGTALGAFAGPIGAIIGLGIGIGSSLIGRGRREANQITPVQNEVTQRFTGIVDRVNELREAGQLTIETLDEAIQQIRTTGTEFFDFADNFERAGAGAIRTISELMNNVIASLETIRPELLTESLDQLNQAIEEVDASLADASASIFEELDKVADTLDAATLNLSEMKDEVRAINPLIESATQQLNDASFWEARRAELLQESTQALQKATDDLLNEYRRLQDESVTLQERFESLQESISDSTAKLADAAYWEQRRADLVSSAQRKVLDTQKQIADLEFQIQADKLNLAIQYGRSEASREAARNQLERLQASRAQSEIVSKQRELDALRDSLTGFVRQAAEAEDNAKQQIASERDELQRLITEQQSALQDVITAQQAVSESLTKIGSLIDVDQEQISRTDELILAWQNARDAAAEAAVSVNQQVAIEKKALAEELRSLEQRRDFLLNELIPAQESEIASLRAYQSQLTEIVNEFGLVRESETDHIQETVDAIREQISALTEQKSALEASRDAIQGMIDALATNNLQEEAENVHGFWEEFRDGLRNVIDEVGDFFGVDPTRQPSGIDGSFGINRDQLSGADQIREPISPLRTAEPTGDQNINISVTADIMTPDGEKAGEYVKDILLEEMMKALEGNYNDSQTRITRTIRVGR